MEFSLIAWAIANCASLAAHPIRLAAQRLRPARRGAPQAAGAGQ